MTYVFRETGGTLNLTLSTQLCVLSVVIKSYKQVISQPM